MFNLIKEINSRWETEKGVWDGEKFNPRSTTTTFCKLTMEIKEQKDRTLLHFRNGPTGFETYNLSDLTLEGEDDFCICGGTINRWPACFVDMKTVKEFVNEYKAAKETS